MLALIEQQPNFYLDEISEQLMEQLNISVSLLTIQRSLKLLDITSKKVHALVLVHTQSSSLFSFPNLWLSTARRLIRIFSGRSVRNLHGILYSVMKVPSTC
jgi:hypothetical protein